MTAGAASPVDVEVVVASHGLDLAGRLTVPRRARGLVVFVPDSSTGYRDVADRHVARGLHQVGFGTMLVDLVPDGLGAGEIDRDLDVLAVRLMVVTRWLRAQPVAAGSQVGYLGVGAGAAVALLAAADDPAIGAVVVRSARLDLVSSVLPAVPTPTLVVVGGADTATRSANERSMAMMGGSHELAVVPGASELFVEPGALDGSASLAGWWFAGHLHASDDTRVRS